MFYKLCVLPVMTTFDAPIALATSKQTNPIGPVQKALTLNLNCAMLEPINYFTWYKSLKILACCHNWKDLLTIKCLTWSTKVQQVSPSLKFCWVSMILPFVTTPTECSIRFLTCMGMSPKSSTITLFISLCSMPWIALCSILLMEYSKTVYCVSLIV